MKRIYQPAVGEGWEWALPGDYVAERWPGLSRVPVLEGGMVTSGNEAAVRSRRCAPACPA